ncbi:MAG: cell division protein FtsZ, partial [Parcubacteria group bacterium]|nr:cell division protein FtsZ [Parcubacteria group bacterium]
MAKKKSHKKAQQSYQGISPRISVVGVGGAGGNAVMRMSGKIRGVEFVVLNTDLQDLQKVACRTKIQIGKTLTRGQGAGMNPDIGRQAAEESRDDISRVLEGQELIFVTCGLGGGTGSGAAPVVAQLARELGVLTVAVVTKPFAFEGKERHKIADEAWKNLAMKVDTIITIPNDRIFNLIARTTPITEAFWKIDDVLRHAVQGVSDLITTPGLINVDFADIHAVMANAGPALFGIGKASGENRAEEAARLAVSSPLLEVVMEGARGVLFHVAGPENIGMAEVNEAAKVITEGIDQNAKVIFGTTFDNRLRKDEMKVTVIATGFPGELKPEPVERRAKPEQTPKTENDEPVVGTQEFFETALASNDTLDI